MKLTFKCRMEGTSWVAQCTEIDLATQARTLDDLLVEVQWFAANHVETSAELGKDPFSKKTPLDVVKTFDNAPVTFSFEVS